MTSNVVYVLGAGFSAPLGLPVMSNFLQKAKDMYAVSAKKYEHFDAVFVRLHEMARIKNYFAADLWNIEEILSILEMENQIGADSATPAAFRRFIKEVVEYYTPPIRVPEDAFRDRPFTNLFGTVGPDVKPWREYGHFVVALMGFRLDRHHVPTDTWTLSWQPPTETYSIVTLNYDAVLELALEHARKYWPEDGPPMPWFDKRPGGGKGMTGISLSKLHGCVRTDVIVPPTWNKALSPGSQVASAWLEAHSRLRNANHIRFIGYSLPSTDSYVQYLLKHALMDAPNLKRIDVICQDHEQGAVKRRYEDLINFPNFRFSNSDVLDYLGVIRNEWTDSKRYIEFAHEKHMSRGF